MLQVQHAVVLGAVMALALTSAVRASALSCEPPGLRVPERGAVEVPTNTRVWCSVAPGTGNSTRVVLRDSSGQRVDGSTTTITTPRFDLLVFHPTVNLHPSSDYESNCVPRSAAATPLDAGFLGSTFSGFTTAAGPRFAPPPVPDVSRVEVAAAVGYWGLTYGASFRDALETGSISVLDLGGGAALDPDGPQGVASSVELAFYSDAWVGAGTCHANWPGASLGASTSIALGSFDVTGAFSGWSDTVTVTLPSEAEPLPEERQSSSGTTPYRGAGHSGCNLRPAPSSARGAAALLALVLAGAARARRGRRG
jgi:hypothetical protein